MSHYAYHLPDGTTGITNSWEECCKYVVKVNGARYRKFNTKDAAETWLKSGAKYERKPPLEKLELEDEIYCDAGTGRGIGVEVRVSDKNGNSLLTYLPSLGLTVNPFENVVIESGSTNNYGELVAMYLAIQIAEKTEKKKVFSDSKLVIDYWSRGVCKSVNIPTRSLSDSVTKQRRVFEENGGSVQFIPGDYNPADLGFHKRK